MLARRERPFRASSEMRHRTSGLGGAHAVLFHRKPHTDPLRMWAKKLIEKKPFKLVAVALANKMARIAFAILRSKTVYREIPV
jgi:transposase